MRFNPKTGMFEEEPKSKKRPKFNEKTGMFEDLPREKRTERTTPSYPPTPPPRYRHTKWDEFNDKISNIQTWLQDDGGPIIAIILVAIPLLIIAGIPLVKMNIEAFSEYGVWVGLLSILLDFLALGLLYKIGEYAFLLMTGIIYVLSYIFYNAYTLIATIIFALGIIYYAVT